MVVNRTSEYDKNAKEVCMMDFKTSEQLDAVPSPRYEYLSSKIIISRTV